MAGWPANHFAVALFHPSQYCIALQQSASKGAFRARSAGASACIEWRDSLWAGKVIMPGGLFKRG
jgi:hypothetical protein